MNYRCVYYRCLGSLSQRSPQWAFLAGIFPFSKGERGGKRGLTNPGGYWVLGVNPRFHVLFWRCRQGQNNADEPANMSAIDLFLLHFTPLGCEGSRGSRHTIRPFTRPAAAILLMVAISTMPNVPDYIFKLLCFLMVSVCR